MSSKKKVWGLGRLIMWMFIVLSAYNIIMGNYGIGIMFIYFSFAIRFLCLFNE